MNNLSGYIDKENSTLKINVTNMPDFYDLLKQAQEEADALQKTMRRLENYVLEIKFHVD